LTGLVEDSETRYVYNGWDVIARFDASSSAGSGQSLALERTYLWGPDLAGALSTGSGPSPGGVGGLLREGQKTRI
jgi:hypothetical protein